MLGRTASSLYWMSRYMERAENLARLLEVGYRISLMPGAVEGHRDEWRSTLQSCACDIAYSEKHTEITSAKVIQFLIFDEDNPSSIRASIKTARNNGRAVRTALTRDVWESINSTWNELAQVKPSSMTADSARITVLPLPLGPRIRVWPTSSTCGWKSCAVPVAVRRRRIGAPQWPRPPPRGSPASEEKAAKL